MKLSFCTSETTILTDQRAAFRTASKLNKMIMSRNKNFGKICFEGSTESTRKLKPYLGFAAEIITKGPFLMHLNPTSPHALQRASSSRSERKMQLPDTCFTL